MRLSTRIALGAAVLVPLLVVAAGVLLLPLVNSDLHRRQDAQLNARAAALLPNARALLAADSRGRPKAEQNQQRKVLDAALDAGVRVAAADGTVLLTAGTQPDDPRLLPADPGAAVTINQQSSDLRVLTVRIDSGGTAGTLWVLAPAGEPSEEVRAVRRRVLLVALLAAPLSGLVAFGLAERATLPLRRLGRRAAALDPRAGQAVFAHARTGTAEVDELSGAIALLLSRYEEQAGRTEQALDTARSFSSAASHELRTPLMSLRTNLDVLAAHPDLPSVERAEVVEELQQDHARMLDLLSALSTLARGDLVEVSAFGPVDLAELVDAAVAEASRRHPGTVFQAELPSEAKVFGWDAGLRILLANLLGNAAVHGRPTDGPTDGPADGPSEVDVRLRLDGGTVRLTVDDRGPGIPPAERIAVFHRFHRRPDSPGSGLGLTLVAQQAALHRGSVAATDRPDAPGCRLEVRLPLLHPDHQTVQLPLERDWLTEKR
ncbi:HAMP domain-containing sensor histidine kinase [Streptomyces sp. TLI_171]|uniref:sensor histidine kinase n=1 Tax=Streptomyces sp. TLI_171 TaxID=1938859 RepID=UPI000C19FD0F|nr:HAMP domain-containing sensor histidine kinase [Streptomyces sp. TLI_171]RKE22368.1 two-component system sensor histidine kinase PrrB [Streptomyces sp. TLI_171]